MKRLYLLVATLFCVNILQAQPRGDVPCIEMKNIPPERISFAAGERITLVASYVWGFTADAGSLTMRMKEETDAEHGPYFHVTGNVESNSFISKFFKVRDTYESMFSMSNLKPFYYMRDIHEGKYSIKNYYRYRSDHNIDARIVHNNGSVTDTLLKAKECTFDVVSIFYFARCLDIEGIKVGEVIPLSFAIDDEVYNISIRFEGRQNKRIPGIGTFKTLKFAAQVVAGVVFTGKEELVFWVSDDKNRLPLAVESPIIVGKIQARLGVYENLKYPLTSLIK